MANPQLEGAKAFVSMRLKRFDRNGDGKIDFDDAQLIAHQAIDDAAGFTAKNPMPAVAWAFAAGAILTLFLVSILK